MSSLVMYTAPNSGDEQRAPVRRIGAQGLVTRGGREGQEKSR